MDEQLELDSMGVGNVAVELGSNLLAVQHAYEISDLKIQLQQKDDEIAKLKEDLCCIQEKKYDPFKLNTKDKEIEELKKKIRNLEDEKRKIQEELAQLHSKVTKLEEDVRSLTNSDEKRAKENQDLNEKIEKIEFRYKNTMERLIEQKKKLEEDLKGAKKTNIKEFREQSLESLCRIHFGEMCSQIQRLMYERVLPENYSSIGNYKIKNIKKDLKHLSEPEKTNAEERWNTLQREINWNEHKASTLHLLQNSRHEFAHPPLKAATLNTHLECLKQAGQLKGSVAYNRVKDLIEIWEKLSSSTTAITSS